MERVVSQRVMVLMIGLAVATSFAASFPALHRDAAPRADVASAREAVVVDLMRHGLDRAAAEERAGQLAEEDVLHFARHPDQIRAAGAVPDYIWILLAVLLGLLILGAIL